MVAFIYFICNLDFKPDEMTHIVLVLEFLNHNFNMIKGPSLFHCSIVVVIGSNEYKTFFARQ